MKINVAMRVPCTEAEGPGKRYALWVQGCPIKCPGCCNPEMIPFEDREFLSVEDLLEEIRVAKEEQGIKGVSLLGGEPMIQAEALVPLAQGVQEMGLTVMIYTGYNHVFLSKGKKPGAIDLLKATDLLVAGPYLKERPDTTRRWIGSTNQTIHALSDAYKELVESWDTSPNTLEVRLVDGKIMINGDPTLMNAWARQPG
jgi:anaerobic ribonucleoside-triphosphate reductase activating protein